MIVVEKSESLSRQHEQNFLGLLASSASNINRSPSIKSLFMSLSLSNIYKNIK